MAAQDGDADRRHRDARQARRRNKLEGTRPFRGHGGDDARKLDFDYGPEASPGVVDLTAAYPRESGGGEGGGGGGGAAPAGARALRWETISTVPFPGTTLPFVDFVAFCRARDAASDDTVGYFATSILAERDQKAQLLVGSDDSVKIWLNGRVVDRFVGTRAVQPADDLVNVELTKGENLLLCKLYNGNGGSGLLVEVAANPAVTLSDTLASPAAPAASQPASQPAVVFKDKEGKVFPSFDKLAEMSGDARAGAAVFRDAQALNCIRCHQIGDEGGMIGPPLTTIGQKLSKAQLYEAIFLPSASILMTYEDWVVKNKDGDVFEGLLAEETPDHISIKDAQGQYHDIKLEDVASRRQLKTSIMPEGLQAAVTRQDMLNLVEYLMTLKNKE